MVWKQKYRILLSNYYVFEPTSFDSKFAIYQERYITTIIAIHILQSIRFIDHTCRYLDIDALTGQISCAKPGIHNLDENGQCRNQLYAVVYIPGLVYTVCAYKDTDLPLAALRESPPLYSYWVMECTDGVYRWSRDG